MGATYVSKPHRISQFDYRLKQLRVLAEANLATKDVNKRQHIEVIVGLLISATAAINI